MRSDSRRHSVGTYRTFVTVAFAVAIAAACDDSRQRLSNDVRVDSAGVEIVAVGARDSDVSLAIEEIFARGGAADSIFHPSVVAADRLAVDPSARTYILDGPEGTVHVVDSLGTPLPPLGRQGSGPGELTGPVGIAIADDGGILVTDRARSVLMHWDRTGALMREQRLFVRLWGYQLRRVQNGVIVMARDADVRGALREKLVRVSGDAAVDIYGFTWPEANPPVYPSCPSYGVEAPPFFAPALRWDARGELIAIVATDRYQIDLYSGDRLVRSIRRDIAPVVVSATAAREEIGDLYVERVGCTIHASERLKVRGHHPVFPVLAGVLIDPQMRIWVRRFIPGRDPDLIDLFSASGEYLGTLPSGTPFPAAFADEQRFVYLEPDSLDVPVLRLVRVRSGG